MGREDFPSADRLLCSPGRTLSSCMCRLPSYQVLEGQEVTFLPTHFSMGMEIFPQRAVASYSSS